MVIAVFVLLAGMLLMAGVLLAWSPGKIRPVVDEIGQPVAGSISEKIWVRINGANMGMFIQSRDPANPVLLFLHGGPGMPEYFLTARYPTGLENDFTMVWWDQRGAGLSFDPALPPETLTVEQYIADIIGVTNYLRERFGKDRIYLLAQSGGSFFGIQAAARAPELYYAYIGMSQMTWQLKSEQLAYDYLLARFQTEGNAKWVAKLEGSRPTLDAPLPRAYDLVRDDAMHMLGVGTTRDMTSIVSGVFLPSWQNRELSLGEKVNLWRGKILCAKMLRETVFSTDLSQQVTRLDLPVYFLHGKYDYTVSYPLARAYFDRIDAPVKGFYTFGDSAHSPFFEEPERMREVLREDVVRGGTSLADGE